MRLAALCLFTLLAAACGSPQAGDTCNTTGFLCQGTDQAIECTVGHWRALPCRGPAACQRVGDSVKCDMTGNVEGDACASTALGKGICTADGLGTLECHDVAGSGLILVKTHTCRTCTVLGDTVTCQP